MVCSKQAKPSLTRIVSGIGLVIVGIVALVLIFDPKGISLPLDDGLTFVLVMFAVSVIIAFGGWLFSQLPLKMFAPPILIASLWFFLFFLPIFLSPLPPDLIITISGLSMLLIVVLFGKYEKSKAKQKKSIQKEGE